MLLDTDVMVGILRQYAPAVNWLASMAAASVALPGIVALELLQGCVNLADQRRVEWELQRFTLFWPTLADCQRAYQDYAAYHLSHGIEILDVFIGHTAVGLNEPLATFNVKHYGVIRGLQTIQPY